MWRNVFLLVHLLNRSRKEMKGGRMDTMEVAVSRVGDGDTFRADP